jgi:hypothetical protein
MDTMGRAIVTFILSLIAVGVLVGIGAEIYQAGVAQGVIDAGRFPAAAAVPVAGYGGYHGFNVLGLLFPILFLFLIFGLLRAAFSRGRGWGHGYGHGYGRGWSSGWDKGEGEGGPSSWREERERRMADMHRRFHEAEGGTDPGPGGSSGGATGGATSR